MGLVALLMTIVGIAGSIGGYIRIVVHAFRDEPVWGCVCLLVPLGNLAWGIAHWEDTEARPLFVRYLAWSCVFVFGVILMKANVQLVE